MGFEIESAADGNKLLINSQGRALVEADTAIRSFFVARDFERTFSVVYDDAAAVAGEFLGYLKNTSQTRIMVVDLMQVSAVEAIQWRAHKVVGTAVGAGTDPVPVNLNFGSGLLAEAEAAVENITGLTSEGLIATNRHQNNDSILLPIAGTIILTPDTAIGIQYFAGVAGEGSATLRFFYENLP